MDGKDIFQYAWALVGGLGMIVWNLLNSKIENNHKNLNSRITETNSAVDKQRDNVAKLFEKIEQHAKESTARHIEILNYLRDKGH